MTRPRHARRWVRAVLALDRVADRLHAAEQALRDELLWAWLAARERQSVTDTIYATEPTYVRGGALFEHGLRTYEQALLAHPLIPRSGRVLLGGAGGGRELVALHERGYAVTAFEPSDPLCRSCASVAATRPGTRVVRAGYAELPAAVHGLGPLAELRADRPYAFVWLGWRSLSHVLEPAARAELFRALARLAPGAPVLLTFAPRADASPPPRSRRWLRRVFAAAGAPATAPAGAWFLPWAGFAVRLSRGDLEDAITGAPYEIRSFGGEPDGFAVLAARD